MKFSKPIEVNTAQNLAAKKLEALQRQQQENLEKQKLMQTSGEVAQRLAPMKHKSSHDARIVGSDFPIREEEMYPDI